MSGDMSMAPMITAGLFTSNPSRAIRQDITSIRKGAEESGSFVLRLDPGVKLLRVHAFAATDVGKVFEGDLNLTTPQGRGLALFSPHEEQPFENRDGWLGERRPDYTVPDDTALYLRWVCRVTGPTWDPLQRTPTGRVETRCHFGLSIHAQELR